MKKKWAMKKIAAVLAMVLTVGCAAPMTVLAEDTSDQVQVTAEEESGLTAAWYKAKDGGREDISRFEFVDSNMLGIVQYDQLKQDGQNFKTTIANLLGHSNDEQFVLAKFTGAIQIPADGTYTFYMEGDDGFRLYVDGELAIDFWYQRWETEQSVTLELTEGSHDIQVDYLQGWGGAWLEMRWASADAGISKQVVPADVFVQTDDNVLLTAKTELGSEIEKASAAYEMYKDSEGADALKTELDKAQAMYDADYSDAEDLEAVAQQMEEQTNALAEAKAALYIAMGTQTSEQFDEFYNPLYQGQDPFITQKDGFYYLVSSSNLDSERKIYVSKSATLTDQGEKKMIMDLSTRGQGRVFAPELYYFETEELGGRWYIYYCADVSNFAGYYPETAAKYTLNSSEHHIACCLRSKTDDPMGEWEDMGPLYCGEDGVIYGANDITAFEYDGSIFLVWGTLGPNQPTGPAIVEMDNPWTVTKDRDMLPVGGGEGPRALKNADGDLFITMSEGDYQSNGYRLSLLCFNGDSKEELLDASKWEAKRDVFTSTATVSGPARASFVKSADGTEDWMVYHSRVYRAVDRNSWRQVSIKQFTWNEDGTPNFGTPYTPNKIRTLPSGDPGQGDMYQAENAVLEGGTYVEDEHFNHQGTGYVHIPNTVGAAVNFVVDAEAAGDYIVGMRYAYGLFEDNATTNYASNQLPSRASMSIYVNGEKVDTLQMDKTNLSWNEYFTGSKRLTLKEGQNLITYVVDSGNIGNVNLDYLTMYKADVPYTELGPVENPVEKALAEAKEAAKKEVAEYKDADDYREAEKAELTKAIEDAVATIESAETVEAVEAAVTEAKEVMDAIKTDAQLTEEEKKKEDEAIAKTLAEAKEAAKKEIAEYKDADDYREAEKAELAKVIEDANAAIEAAETTEAVEAAVADAKEAMDAIKTAEQLKLPFDDVTEDDWFYDAVAYNYFEELMTGMTDTTFGPYESLSRAQFATILYRMSGSPEVEYEPVFKDINGEEWYASPVLWAQKNGIVSGYEGGLFGPADMITREQMAVMMYRYAKYLKEDVSVTADLDAFTDGANVSDFATEAMQWAVGNGIITGKEGGTKLDPQGNTARSECAVIIQRFEQ